MAICMITRKQGRRIKKERDKNTGIFKVTPLVTYFLHLESTS